MKVTTTAIEDGYFLDRYGAKGEDFVNGMPSLSIPFEIHDAPAGTVSYAFVLDDYDAVPVCGFDWIHWMACDLRKTSVREGESRHTTAFTEGCNSWHGIADKLTVDQATGYGGMAPPDKTHRYTLKVYALDTELMLPCGFMLNNLHFSMKGHVLAHTEVMGLYSPKK